VLPKKYFLLGDKCATTVVEGLKSGLGELNTIYSFSPYQLEWHLQNGPGWLVRKVNFYPGKKQILIGGIINEKISTKYAINNNLVNKY